MKTAFIFDFLAIVVPLCYTLQSAKALFMCIENQIKQAIAHDSCLLMEFERLLTIADNVERLLHLRKVTLHNKSSINPIPIGAYLVDVFQTLETLTGQQ